MALRQSLDLAVRHRDVHGRVPDTGLAPRSNPFCSCLFATAFKILNVNDTVRLWKSSLLQMPTGRGSKAARGDDGAVLVAGERLAI